MQNKGLFLMLRDYERQGAMLIKTKFGLVSVDNFNVTPETMAENQNWLEAVGAKTGVFCLAPWELDIPF
jgi:hypothetical protein